MLAKKLAVLIATAAISAPAFADRGNHYGHGHRFDHRPYHVVHRPVVHHYYHYRPAPRPVVVYHQPRPVYYHSHPNTGAALLVGAILGAAIVHHVVTGY